MASLNDILSEANPKPNGYDSIRLKYLQQLQSIRKRNIVCYYSGWMSRPHSLSSINDEDKNGFMAAFHNLDFKLGLDLILHTPGGDVAAVESIIHYLREMFKDNISVFVPQISMSGGTMIACAGKEIFMGKHSNLGPIDPQFGDIPAFLVLKEKEKALEEMGNDPRRRDIWYPILNKYPVTFFLKCENAIKWSEEIAVTALKTGMFKGLKNGDEKAKKIASKLNSHDDHLSHGRHLHKDELKSYGLKIKDLENDQDLQNAVLSVHHSYMATLMNTNAIKIIENHNGKALIRNIAYQQIIQQ